MDTRLKGSTVAGISAVLIVGFLGLHGFLTPPWEVLTPGEEMVALGTWAVAPCTLAALALLVGNVDLSSRRPHPFGREYCEMVAALLPLVILALIAAMRDPATGLPDDWATQLLPVALIAGVGFALVVLWWQGVVQPRMPDHWPVVMRVFVATAAAAAIWIPFWAQTEPSADGGALWFDMALISAVAATLHELGISTRLIMVLAGFTGAAAVYLHGGTLL